MAKKIRCRGWNKGEIQMKLTVILKILDIIHDVLCPFFRNSKEEDKEEKSDKKWRFRRLEIAAIFDKTKEENKMRKIKIKQIINTDNLNWTSPNCLDTRYLEYLVKMYNERLKYVCGYSMVNVNNYLSNRNKNWRFIYVKRRKNFYWRIH